MSKYVSDFMIKDPVCIEKNAPLKTIHKLVNKKGFSYLPVTDKGQLVGILCKSDLMSRFLTMLEDMGTSPSSEFEELPAEMFMTRNPSIIMEDENINTLLDLFLEKDFQSIIAVNKNNEVKGLITSYDLLDALYLDSTSKKISA